MAVPLLEDFAVCTGSAARGDVRDGCSLQSPSRSCSSCSCAARSNASSAAGPPAGGKNPSAPGRDRSAGARRALREWRGRAVAPTLLLHHAAALFDDWRRRLVPRLNGLIQHAILPRSRCPSARRSQPHRAWPAEGRESHRECGRQAGAWASRGSSIDVVSVRKVAAFESASIPTPSPVTSLTTMASAPFRKQLGAAILHAVFGLRGKADNELPGTPAPHHLGQNVLGRRQFQRHRPACV